MKVLLYCLNYAPELTGIGKYTTEQAQWLAARGHDIRVISAPPYYPAWRVADGYRSWRYRIERIDGVTVYRAPLWVPHRPSGLSRLLHLASFAIGSIPCLIAQWNWNPDLIFLVEPPLACSPAALLFGHWKRCATWLHIQDYEVDAAFALGLLKHPWLRVLATQLEHFSISRFDRVSTISRTMEALARRKGVSPERLVALPNWADLHAIGPASKAAYRAELGILDQDVVALYSGNMGSKQGLEILAEAAHRLTHRQDIHFVFCGAGAGLEDLRRRANGLARAHFLPLQTAERFPALLAAADIHLMPQRADAADLVLPSKLAGMLASGRPVVATAQQGTELARLAERFGAVTPPGDAVALADAIAALADQPARRKALGAAGRAWAERHLDRDLVLGDLERALLRLTDLRRRAANPVDGIGENDPLL